MALKSWSMNNCPFKRERKKNQKDKLKSLRLSGGDKQSWGPKFVKLKVNCANRLQFASRHNKIANNNNNNNEKSATAACNIKSDT
ncbi:unnamed protein product [Ceratitis capitata]|uniref:(Mediterranean fruit fly) hypothetical protein n=1 Tax=Ceratitis capitata TaxID=7213 RepID=A0A811V9J5_CERCA|nr:unnamed protein product [Ceratitis capitata]